MKNNFNFFYQNIVTFRDYNSMVWKWKNKIAFELQKRKQKREKQEKDKKWEKHVALFYLVQTPFGMWENKCNCLVYFHSVKWWWPTIEYVYKSMNMVWQKRNGFIKSVAIGGICLKTGGISVLIW